MAIWTGGVVTQQVVASNVQFALGQFRKALHDIDDLYTWLSGYAKADLVALGFSDGDAQAILDAVADAHQESVIHGGGTTTATLPYNFGASQARVVGPLRF